MTDYWRLLREVLLITGIPGLVGGLLYTMIGGAIEVPTVVKEKDGYVIRPGFFSDALFSIDPG